MREGEDPADYWLKRPLDLILSALGLVIALPMLTLVALWIKIDSRGPVFFVQDRLGRRGRVFRIVKFRTMTPGSDRDPQRLLVSQDDPRITSVGAILRKYRIDEIPQLLNVLKGEMSLVGPRPLLPEHLASYTEFERRRLLAAPGITGWQQVHGGSNNTWDERIALDVWYVDHRSLKVDLHVLGRTIAVVLRADSVYGSDGWQRSGVPDRSIAPADDSPDQPEEKE